MKIQTNNIALNALHDKAFDRGLITFDTELRLVCAPSLRDQYAEAATAQSFKAEEAQSKSLSRRGGGPKAGTPAHPSQAHLRSKGLKPPMPERSGAVVSCSMSVVRLGRDAVGRGPVYLKPPKAECHGRGAESRGSQTPWSRAPEPTCIYKV